jgi:hypothetical protein
MRCKILTEAKIKIREHCGIYRRVVLLEQGDEINYEMNQW